MGGARARERERPWSSGADAGSLGHLARKKENCLSAEEEKEEDGENEVLESKLKSVISVREKIPLSSGFY